MINRKEAEACRREAMRLEREPNLTEAGEAMRRHYVSVWNNFCAEEQARIDAKREPKAQVYATYRKLGWA